MGNLVKRGLSFDKGYLVRYSGAADAGIPQAGYPGYPNLYLSSPELKKGLNYLGVPYPP